MYQMDETDYEILEILKGDGRCSYSDIAEQVTYVDDLTGSAAYKKYLAGIVFTLGR